MLCPVGLMSLWTPAQSVAGQLKSPLRTSWKTGFTKAAQPATHQTINRKTIQNGIIGETHRAKQISRLQDQTRVSPHEAEQLAGTTSKKLTASEAAAGAVRCGRRCQLAHVAEEKTELTSALVRDAALRRSVSSGRPRTITEPRSEGSRRTFTEEAETAPSRKLCREADAEKEERSRALGAKVAVMQYTASFESLKTQMPPAQSVYGNGWRLPSNKLVSAMMVLYNDRSG